MIAQLIYLNVISLEGKGIKIVLTSLTYFRETDTHTHTHENTQTPYTHKQITIHQHPHTHTHTHATRTQHARRERDMYRCVQERRSEFHGKPEHGKRMAKKSTGVGVGLCCCRCFGCSVAL